jgi:tRNA pseudouridine synthase 10
MIRDKIIHALKIVPINKKWLVIYVLSSAGTYIKEFIHSDLDRTTPNMCTLLENECDIF